MSSKSKTVKTSNKKKSHHVLKKVLITVATVLALAGVVFGIVVAIARHPVFTQDDFRKAAKANSMSVSTESVEHSEIKNIPRTSLVAKSGRTAQVEYYNYSSKNKASKAYNDVVEAIKSAYAEDVIPVTQTRSRTNFKMTSATFKGTYYCIVQSGDTVVYGSSDESESAAVRAIIQSIAPEGSLS